MGLLDLPAPVLDLIHRALQGRLPAIAELALWAALSACASMAIYRRISPQARLQALAAEIRVLTQTLAGYDGGFAGLRNLIGRLLALNLEHLAKTFAPALASSLPLLFVLPWLSDTFEHAPPSPGSTVTVTAVPIASVAAQYEWVPPQPAISGARSAWLITWPSAERSLLLRAVGDRVLLRLPLAKPVAIVQVRSSWNWLVGNPAGYLPQDGPIETVAFDLPPLEIVHFGPSWARGWLPYFLCCAIACSLLLKRLWRIE